MYAEKKETGLKIIVTLAIINSLATVVHFVLMGVGRLTVYGLVGDTVTYVVPAVLIGVLPITLGAVGLYRRKMWGISYFGLGSGGYLYGALTVFLTYIKSGHQGIMFYIALYLILYHLIANIYVWMYRFNLRDF